MPDHIDAHATPWREIILTCRKCGKKLDNKGFGPGGGATLARALKDELRREHRRRDVRVMETKCLGLCPKRAVTVLLARSPGELLEIPAGTAAASVLARLGQA